MAGNGVELAVAYLSIVPDTSKVAPGVTKALGGLDVPASKSGQSMGSKIADGIGSVLKRGVKATGLAAGAALGVSLTKGLGRLNALDQANAKLEGLGRTSAEVDSIMGSVSKSVKGTAFGLGEAAGAAAMFSTTGVKAGEDMDRVMGLLADTSAQAGTNLDEIAPILAKIVAQGGLTTETFDQLNERATGVGEALSKHLGIPMEEVRDKAKEINFEDFAAAMDANIGGAAKKTGETVKGAMDNAGAAMGRLGEAILAPAFEAAPSILGGITGKVDDLTAAVSPVAKEWSAKLGKSMQDFATKIAPDVQDALTVVGDGVQGIAGAAKSAAPVLKTLGSALGKVPWELYAAGITGAVAKHSGLTDALGKGSGGIKDFMKEVSSTRSTLRDHGIDIGVVGSALDVVGKKYPAIERMTQAFNDASLPLRSAGSAATEAGWEIGGMEGVVKKAGGSIQTMAGVAAGAASGGFSLLKSGAKGIMDMLGGPWGVAFTVAGGVVAHLAGEHKKAAEEERKHKERQQELRDSLDETTGSVTEQTRALQLKSLEDSGAMDTARDLGLSQDTVADAMNGNAEAMERVRSATRRSTEAAIEGTDYWAKFGDDFESVGFSISDMADYMDGATTQADGFGDALDKVQEKYGDVGSTYATQVGSGNNWHDFKSDMAEATGATNDLSDALGTARDELSEALTTEAEDSLRSLSSESEKATKALDILGDNAAKLGESPNELVVDLTQLSDGERVDIKNELEEIGLATNLEDGVLTVTFDSAAGILESLNEIEGKVNWLPNGTLDIEANTDEVNGELERMGVLSRDQHGNLTMNDNLREVIDRLIEADLFVVDPKTSSLTISSNAQDILDEAKNKLNSPNGDTKSKHVITEEYLTSTAELYGGADKDRSVVRNLERKKRNADGGRIPKSAVGRRIGDRRGYQLPTSGPGTDEEDGILGVGEDGTPTSWVDAGEWIINADSSEQYDGLLAAVNSGDADAVAAAAEMLLPRNAGGGMLGGGGEKIQAGMSLGLDLPGADQFNPLLDGFTAMATGIQEQATNLVDPALSGMATTMTTMASGFVTAVGAQISPAMTQMGTVVSTVKTALVDPAFAGIQAGLGVTATVFGTATAGARNVWSQMGNLVMQVKTGTVDPAFAGIQAGLVAVEQSFATGTAGANAHFSTIQAGTAGPARYTIGSVFNGGIVQMWNSAADYLGTSKMSPAPMNFATGGHVRGPGGPTDDKIPAMLSNGEFVIKAKAVEKIGVKNLNAINDGHPVAAKAYKSDLPTLMNTDATWKRIASKYNQGGPAKGSAAWKQIKRGMDWARQLSGREYVLGGDPVGGGGTDCSGYQSSVADRIGGGAGHRQWATMAFNGGTNSQAQSGPQGFVAGLAAGHAIGVVNGGPAGGHTAGTIGGLDGLPATNIESGGSHGYVSFGGPAVGADNSLFPTQYHLPLVGDRFISGGGGGPSISQLVDAAIGPHKEQMAAAIAAWGNPAGLVNEWPPRTGSSLGEMTLKKLEELAAEMDAKSGSAAGVDLSGLNGDTQQVAKEVFARHGMTGSEWEDAAWIVGRESSWDTNATNASSGAYGLGQLNPSSGTLQQYDPGKSPDAATQSDAMARYIKDTYGTAAAARAHHEQYGWYDNGGYLKPGVTQVHNETGKPEPVFTSHQWKVLRASVSNTAALVPPIQKWVDNGLDELERIANTAKAGWDEWAAANDEHGRLGSPAEIAAHYGGQAAKEFAGDALGLVGLDGLADVTFSDSFVNLVNAASDTIKDQFGVRLGHIGKDSMQPQSVLDENLRHAKPQEMAEPVMEDPAKDLSADELAVDADSVTVEPEALDMPADESVDALQVEALDVQEPESLDMPELESIDVPDVDSTLDDDASLATADLDSATAPAQSVQITLEGDAFGAEQVEKMLGEVNGRVTGLDVRVTRIESAQTAAVTAGVAMLA